MPSQECHRWPGWRCSRPAGHDGSCPLLPRWWNIPARMRIARVMRRSLKRIRTREEFRRAAAR